MACARCGCGVYQTEDVITLNKIWHKCCFTCYRCKCHLDKCSAKICQGEVFCENCYNCMIEELEVTPSPSRPCRVASSPSCSCVKEEQTPCCEHLPSFDYCKKYEVCFPAEEKVKCAKTCQSCSCIPDKRDNCCKKDPYCFAFPLPREVANYYNREYMKPRKYTSPPNCCPKEEPCCRKDNEVCIKIRTLSPKQPCGSCCRSPARCRPPCAEPEKCCCSKCCPPPRRKGCACCPRPTCRAPKRCTPARRKPCLPCTPCPPCTPCSPCRPRTPCGPCSPCRPCTPCKPHSPCRPRTPCSPCQPRSPCRPRSPCSPCSSCQPCRGRRKPQECSRKPPCSYNCPVRAERKECSRCCESMPKYCPCGNLNPCDCNICQVQALCTAICVRCGYKVYAAERILVTSGAYHTCCFSCYCCHKLLDVKNVFENCGEIYCKQCYNNFFGAQYYGYGSSQVC